MVAAALRAAEIELALAVDRGELAARLRVGRRIVTLQTGETVVYSFARAVDEARPYRPLFPPGAPDRD